jgi:hypothetical protein
MSPWVWLLLISGILLASYLLFFFLSSVLQRGSPLYIRASYYTKAFVRQILAIGRELVAAPSRPAPPASARPMTPQETFWKAEFGRPLEDILPPKAEPVKKAPEVRKIRKPDPRPGFARPTTEPFTLAVAQEAVRDRRRVWVKYRHENNAESEEKLEIYRVSGAVFRAWCSVERKRDILRLNGVVAWHVLDERFERAPLVEQWAGEEGLFPMLQRLEVWLRKRRLRRERHDL